MAENKINYNKLISFDAEIILHKYGNAFKVLGFILLIIGIIAGIIEVVDNYDFGECVLSILLGVSGLLSCIVIKAFIDVFVNISLTLRDMNSSKEESE